MNWRVVLILSLGLNVLFAALAWKSRSRPAPEAGLTSAAVEPIAVEPVVRVITNEVVLTQSTPAPELVWPTWNELTSADWGEFRTNLLAVGCPSETVRDILLAALRRERYAERRPILAAVNPIFWDEIARHGFEPKTGPLKEALEQLEELDQKHNALEQAVLAGLSYGNEAEERLRKEQDWEQQFGHLDPEVRQRVSALQEEHERRREELVARHRDERGRLSPEGQAALKQLESDRRLALADLMGPEAAAEWNLRTAGHANWAANLRGLDLSPEEIRQIAGLKAGYADYLKSLPADEVAVDERFLARYGLPNNIISPEAEALDNRIRELLGDERYAIMQQANDRNYVQLYDLAERFDLPPQAITQGLQMQRDAQAAGEQIRANQQLTAAQRRDALAAIQRESQQAFEQLLGPEAYYTYQRHGGEWLRGGR
jgi:hypothetical protein